VLGLLILLFIAVPFVELAILLSLADHIGWLPPLVLVVLTGVVGASLARRQGIQTLARIQGQVNSGKFPSTELADAGMILFAGALLLTPGILTDLFGFSLLVPPIRGLYRRGLAKYFRGQVQVRYGTGFSPDAEETDNDKILEAEVISRRNDSVDSEPSARKS